LLRKGEVKVGPLIIRQNTNSSDHCLVRKPSSVTRQTNLLQRIVGSLHLSRQWASMARSFKTKIRLCLSIGFDCTVNGPRSGPTQHGGPKSAPEARPGDRTHYQATSNRGLCVQPPFSLSEGILLGGAHECCRCNEASPQGPGRSRAQDLRCS
jgi:hypothetical protein